ncbi:hypothetical protein CJ483_22965 [Bacillus sp. PK3_68]|nr:hypothetical protein CJ483_22965 [Bacillus sp. PK3_68]
MLQQIENSREQMNQITKIKSLFSAEVIEISHYLDHLLNKYELIKKQLLTAINKSK